SILRIPLDSPKSEPQVIYHTDYYVESCYRAVSLLNAYKNYLYFIADERDADDKGPGSSANYIDLDTLEVNSLPQVEGEQLYYISLLNDNMIATYYNREADENIYFKCDLRGNIIEKMFQISQDDFLFYSTDGKYIYGDNRTQIIKGKSQQQTITVYDLDMNEIDSFVLPKFIEKVCNYINPQDNDYFIFESVNENKERTLVMADKSQIGSIGGKTIECTELCKLKWKEEDEDKPYVEANNG
ncbi:MAG: hypothetical protein MJ089_08660, partial [Ruminococcus sp.]|nr:hypothetical protein [Ruminococcus sp.]